MGKLEYKQKWIILATTRPKKGKSSIYYLKKGIIGTIEKPPAKYKGTTTEVPDDNFFEFDSRIEALSYLANKFPGEKYCFTVLPSFRKPKLKRDQKSWFSEWKNSLLRYIESFGTCSQPRRRKRRIGTVATQRTKD